MIDEIARNIDPRLNNVNGRVFYSGRAAFEGQGRVYVLGYNPGGAPDEHEGETISAHTRYVLDETPACWSAYCNDSWMGKAPGQKPLQRRVRHLLNALGLDPRETPSSNLIFKRSSNSSAFTTAEKKELAEACWPVHDAVLRLLAPSAIICLGHEAGDQVRRRVGATQKLDTFTERNGREWSSHAYKAPSGLLVFSLTHPGRADWTAAPSDPSPFVRDMLRQTA
ncbi:uracil-DNA glycosylase family protein [Futiania mangrovi]|uniref:Uracil-DNA glycosylase family protein n=1 Tax=Futiania mangrovi TaxID=2959716 RepID=A0A9J6PBN4_9PROT|nr:uracil-DNA glycosylase family protein [Futiania mangrovii]MCP1335160.1 uracil-DNA glycosylase family protein [Futiania mangrovii]